jgi:hypothetical protein
VWWGSVRQLYVASLAKLPFELGKLAILRPGRSRLPDVDLKIRPFYQKARLIFYIRLLQAHRHRLRKFRGSCG